jgi:multiple sugar transport system permease protein
MARTRTLREKFGHGSRYMLLVPVLTLLSVVILIPEIMAFFLSFTTYSPGDVPVYVGFKNYIEILMDRYFLNALINNLIFLASIICREFLVGF